MILDYLCGIHVITNHNREAKEESREGKGDSGSRGQSDAINGLTMEERGCEPRNGDSL
jgi:hypothetical protein